MEVEVVVVVPVAPAPVDKVIMVAPEEQVAPDNKVLEEVVVPELLVIIS